MNHAQASVVDTYIRAATRLLMDDGVVAPGLALLAGPPLTPLGRLEIAALATDTDSDLVYLAIDLATGSEPQITSVAIFCPRDGACFGWTDCRLSLRADGRRAAIVPPPTIRGHFEVLCDEIVHRSSKPSWIDAGVAHAAARLDELIRTDLSTDRQVVVRTYADAA